VSADILRRDAELRVVLTRLQQRSAAQNEASKLIGQAKAKKDEAQAGALMAEVAGLKEQIQKGRKKSGRCRQHSMIFSDHPQFPAAMFPTAPTKNPIEIRRFGRNLRSLSSQRSTSSSRKSGQMISKRRPAYRARAFVVLKRGWRGSTRHRPIHARTCTRSNSANVEMSPPYLVRDQAMFGTGQLPKFADDLFHTTTTTGWWPTAEVPLTISCASKILTRRSCISLHRYTPASARGGSGGQGHPRHDPHAPILQSGIGLDHTSGTVDPGARAHDELREEVLSASACISDHAALRRRYRVPGQEDL